MSHLFASSSCLLIFRRPLVILSDRLRFTLYPSEGCRPFDADNRGDSSLSFSILVYQLLNLRFSGGPIHPIVDSEPVKYSSQLHIPHLDRGQKDVTRTKNALTWKGPEHPASLVDAR